MLKDPTTNAGDLRDTGSILGLGRSPGNANGQPSPVFLPGESHGQRSLAGHGPWDLRESDMIEVTKHARKHNTP